MAGTSSLDLKTGPTEAWHCSPVEMSAFWVPVLSTLSLVCFTVHRILATFARYPAYQVSSPFLSPLQSPIEFIVRTDYGRIHELPKANRVAIAYSLKIMALQSNWCELESGLCKGPTVWPWRNQPSWASLGSSGLTGGCQNQIRKWTWSIQYTAWNMVSIQKCQLLSLIIPRIMSLDFPSARM